MTDDAALVAAEIHRLRALHGDDALPRLQADLLDEARPELAARFLREQALRALKRIDPRRDPWVVSAALQLEVYREAKQLDRQRTPIPQPMSLEADG